MLRVLSISALLDFHVHQDLNRAFYVINQCEPIDLHHLLFLFLELIFVVVVNLGVKELTSSSLLIFTDK